VPEVNVSLYICAADESSDENPRDRFYYGGFGGPEDVWVKDFVPAWRERVLESKPNIEYLHFSETSRDDWRRENKITGWQVDQKLDEAARVIRSTGGLVPVTVSLAYNHYDKHVRRKFRPKPEQKQPYAAVLEADYVCFIGFAIIQLDFLVSQYDDVERVDFWVEKNRPITRLIPVFHDRLCEALEAAKRPDLVPLVGHYREVDKGEIHPQAADILIGHTRRHIKGTRDISESRRHWEMTEGNAQTGRGMRGRYGFHHKLEEGWLEGLGAGLDRYDGS
jgi:hypothetical protein